MGPKKEKKKKKSKAELEQERIDRERQEEIDAKERARKLEEQREREREAEQRLKEAQKQARVEELELLNVEAREEAGVMERRRARIDEERAADEEARAWENYRLYDDMTETRIQADLGGDFTLDEALERAARTERISQSPRTSRADAVARGDAAAALRCGRFLHRLRDGVVAQLDRATAHVLQHADDTSAKSEDAEKKEIFVVGSDVAAEAAALKREEAKAAAGLPGHAAGKDEEPKAGAGATRVGVWANLTIKTLRGPFKQLGFQDVDLHVDLPKTLGTQRLGARVFLLPYEHVDTPFVYTGSGVPAPNQYLRARVVVPESIIVPAAPDDASDSPLASRAADAGPALRGVVFEPAARRAPYDSEVEEACCRLSLATPRFEVVIEVRGDGSCTLLEPSRVPELAGLLGTGGARAAMKPGRLLAALSKAGIHLRPDDADAAACTRKRASFALKHGDVERKLCEEVAARRGVVRLRPSAPRARTWAATAAACGPRETSTYVGGGGNALDFMTVLVERDAASKSAREAPGVGELPGAAVKCTLVMGDENYDEVPPGGVDPETAPPASMDRVRKAPLKFQQTVEALHLTRPFSFF
ncbi:hypothetical protein SO694_00097067 [Aureococcus anophagefferens]|uniref:IC97/Casc1 N-terminal domain-containing protein n=1 Tax=Aureococcus anophagefferens TaxID=44056 RepID=A0ABR1FS61_AURAN